MTAVKRAWRGRGIAGALKAAEINWALDNGYTELYTSNEKQNAPIQRLNAHLGYRPRVERIHLVGPCGHGVHHTTAHIHVAVNDPTTNLIRY